MLNLVSIKDRCYQQIEKYKYNAIEKYYSLYIYIYSMCQKNSNGETLPVSLGFMLFPTKILNSENS